MQTMRGEVAMNSAAAITKRHPREDKKRKAPAQRLILPGVIVVALLTQIPFIGTLFLSLFNWNILLPNQGMRFIGFGNYATALTDPNFYISVWHSIAITAASLVLCLVLGTLFALLMNREFFGRGFVRSLIITPFFMMSTISAIIWKDIIFDPSFGLFAWVMRHVGLQPISVAQNDPLLLVILIITWRWTPFFMLIILAGLQSFPEEITESSSLDGANAVQRFFFFVIPHLMRYIEVAVFLGLIFILQTFGSIFVATQGGPGFASTNLAYLVYRQEVQNYQYGYASSVSVLFVILTVIGLSLLFKNIRNRFGETLR